MNRRGPAAAGRALLKPLDVLAVVLCVAVVAAVSVHAYGAGRGQAVAELDGRDGQWLFPLDQPRTIHVAGPLGDTVVVIEGGSVRVSDSPCAEKICVRTGRISRPGQFIACLPNQVFVTVKGSPGQAIDAYSF